MSPLLSTAIPDISSLNCVAHSHLYSPQSVVRCILTSVRQSAPANHVSGTALLPVALHVDLQGSARERTPPQELESDYPRVLLDLLLRCR